MSDRTDDVRRYNDACQRVNEAIEALRAAGDGTDLGPLESSFRAAIADAEQARSVMERAEELNSASQRYTPKTTPTALGMDPKQVRAYSLLRAINAAASNDWRGAELEREASDEIAQRLGREAAGFFLPMDVQQRDLTVTPAVEGGHLVATDLMSGSFIDMLRNRPMVAAAGATFLTDLVGNVAIPRQTGGATGHWVAESMAPTESQQNVDQVPLTPRTFGAFTDISRRLLKQSSISAEDFVRRDLAVTCALGIDTAALHGTGAGNQPFGIAATAGVGSVVGGTNGLIPALSHIVSLESEVAVDNADLGSLSYMTNARVRGRLKQTPRVASTDSLMLWADGPQPLNGYPTHVTNQVSSTLTKGTSVGNCSAIFFGNWSDLVIGMWGVVDFLVDPYTAGNAGTVRVVALQDIDIAVRHAQSFAVMLDALT